MFNRATKTPSNRTPAAPVFTILSEGTRWQGELQAGADGLRIEGELEGTLMSDGLVVVAPTGHMRGTLHARHLTVTGRVEGTVRVAECLEILGSGWVEGEVEMGTLVVDEGGTLQGNCVRLAPLRPKEPLPLLPRKEAPGSSTPAATSQVGITPGTPIHGREFPPMGRVDRGRY
jgi:cytoskeletal protein CcmA (bactofilin family)